MDNKTFIAHGLSKMGIYPYPEITIPVLHIFDNKATKEEIDYIGSVTKSRTLKRKFAKLYDEYQTRYVLAKETL